MFFFCSVQAKTYRGLKNGRNQPSAGGFRQGMRLTIRHETHYSYERPVRFGPHRLLIRPRDSHAIRIAEAHLAFSPRGDTRWSYDALGNSVCWLTLDGE